MRSIRLTRQTWLALSAALAFVGLALLLVVLPTPYVIYSPGKAYDLATGENDQPMVRVEGLQTYPLSGKIHMTTVAVSRPDTRTSLPQAFLAYWLPRRDAMPRDAVYEPGKTRDEVRAEERMMMDTSQQDAIVAALREASVPVEELPVVSTVLVSGPANGRLQPGDQIRQVEGVPVRTLTEVADRMRTVRPGTSVRLTVSREGRVINADITTIDSVSEPGRALIGVELGLGYSFTPTVNFGISHDIGGPSAGLMFALAIYDQISPDDVLQGRSIAGTGRISPSGQVGAIGGVQEKIASAEAVGASVFLVPARNCQDLEGLQTDLEIVRVDTLHDAVRGLAALQDPARVAEVPRC
ncbi:MAG: S16 family serine protease [Propionibacteriaceae bacterium]|nr:S16 family serine protease [Propionibacteriaceae bacterium]